MVYALACKHFRIADAHALEFEKSVSSGPKAGELRKRFSWLPGQLVAAIAEYVPKQQADP